MENKKIYRKGDVYIFVLQSLNFNWESFVHPKETL